MYINLVTEMFSYLMSIVALLLLGSLATAQSNLQAVQVLFKPLPPASSGLITKGVLEYDIEEGTANFKSLTSSLEEISGRGCFGVLDSLENFQCMALAEVSIPNSIRYHLSNIYLNRFLHN